MKSPHFAADLLGLAAELLYLRIICKKPPKKGKPIREERARRREIRVTEREREREREREL